MNECENDSSCLDYELKSMQDKKEKEQQQKRKQNTRIFQCLHVITSRLVCVWNIKFLIKEKNSYHF